MSKQNLCSALVSFLFVVCLGSASDMTATAQTVTPQTAAAAVAPPNLTGTYTGTVYYPVDGLVGEATLTVTGNTFTLQQGSNNRTGTLLLNDRAHAFMKFDNSDNKPLSLRVAGTGNRLTLKTAPEEVQAFEFKSGGRASDLRSAAREAKPLSHEGAVTAIAFSPDGSRMASGSKGEIFLWDTARGGVINSLTGVSGTWVTYIVFSPDKTTLAAALRGGVVALYNAADGAPLGSLPGTTGLSVLAFSPDGKLLAGVGDDGKLVVWDMMTKQVVKTVGDEGSFRSVAFSPVGGLLAGGGRNGSITLWDSSSFTQTDQWSASNSQINALAFSRDGKLLASGGKDKNVNLWGIDKGMHAQTPRTLAGHEDSVTSLSFSSDNRTLASASLDMHVILWNVATAEKNGDQKTSGVVYAVAFWPNRKSFATGGKDSSPGLWEVK